MPTKKSGNGLKHFIFTKSKVKPCILYSSFFFALITAGTKRRVCHLKIT